MNAQKLLLNAIKELVAEKSFEQITVQNILDRAEVSRSTFYKYFNDKYELANTYYESYVSKIILPQYNGKNWRELLLLIAVFVKQNKSYFISIMKTQDFNSFEKFLDSFGLKFYQSVYKYNMKKESLSKEEVVKSEFVNYGSCFVFLDWIKSGCKESVENIVTWIIDMTPEIYTTYLE